MYHPETVPDMVRECLRILRTDPVFPGVALQDGSPKEILLSGAKYFVIPYIYRDSMCGISCEFRAVDGNTVGLTWSLDNIYKSREFQYKLFPEAK